MLRTLIATLLLASASIVQGTEVKGETRVIDGDTLEFGGITYRLNGVDAPEFGQRCQRRDGGTWACGQEALAALSSFIVGKDVRCNPISADGYGRTIATCYADNEDVGAMMVSKGCEVSQSCFIRFSFSSSSELLMLP